MGHEQDLDLPACCSCCPYLQAVTASCTHELRQSLLRELDADDACPVYVRLKTDRMRRLSQRSV